MCEHTRIRPMHLSVLSVSVQRCLPPGHDANDECISNVPRKQRGVNRCIQIAAAHERSRQRLRHARAFLRCCRCCRRQPIATRAGGGGGRRGALLVLFVVMNGVAAGVAVDGSPVRGRRHTRAVTSRNVQPLLVLLLLDRVLLAAVASGHGCGRCGAAALADCRQVVLQPNKPTTTTTAAAVAAAVDSGGGGCEHVRCNVGKNAGLAASRFVSTRLLVGHVTDAGDITEVAGWSGEAREGGVS